MTSDSRSRVPVLRCDHTALKALNKRLRSLDERGGVMDMKELWLGAKGTSDELKVLKQTLRAISSSLTDVINLANDWAAPDARGILHLPVELIANIFEQAVVDPLHDKAENALRISHVCKHFRSSALNIPSLWDDISDDWRHELVELFLARCTKPMIRARFDRDAKEKKHNIWESVSRSSFTDSSFVGLVESLPKDSTFRGFSVVYHNLDDGHQAIDALAQSQQSGHFTHLEHLGISCTAASGLRHGTVGGPFLFNADMETLSSLELPALKSLHCGSMYPRTINAPQLVECEVSLNSFRREAEWDTRRLRYFLKSISSIRFLKLEFLQATLLVPDTPAFPSSEAVELSNLEHLSIVIRQHTSPALLEELMANLELPNVKRMSIDAHFSNRHVLSADSWFSALFRQEPESDDDEEEEGVPRIFNNVEKLDLRLFDETFDDENVIPCDAMFSSLPALRCLSVEAPGLPCFMNWDWNPSDLKELRVLRLNNCHYIAHMQEGESFVDSMRPLGSFEHLERVEFNNCPDMMKWKEDVEEVFPREKLRWTASSD